MDTRTVEECQRLSISALPLSQIKGSAMLELGKQIILLSTTPCYYGGKRYWFTCPKCNLRTGVLYLPPQENTYECRKCKRLIYELTKYRKGRLEKITRLQHRIKASY